MTLDVVGHCNITQYIAKMNKGPADELIEIIDNAKSNRIRIAQLTDVMQDAQKQIQWAARSESDALTDHFNKLKTLVQHELDERLKVLLEEISNFEFSEVSAIQAGFKDIEEKQKVADDLLAEGKKLLMSELEQFDSKSLKELKEKCSLCNVDDISLPSRFNEPVFLASELPAGFDKLLSDTIRSYGRLLTQPPVAISDIQDRPGALQLSWAEQDEVGYSSYQLQFCEGRVDVTTASTANFQLAYEGPSQQFTVRQLSVAREYSFRVRGLTELDNTWTAWCGPVVGTTSLPCREWAAGVPGYELRDEGSTAVWVECERRPPLVTASASYLPAHSVLVHITHLPSHADTDGVGLSANSLVTGDTDVSFLKPGCVFITAAGKVYLNGHERASKLPRLKQGSKVVFESELPHAGKMRLTVEVDEKVATFDWPLDTMGPAPPANEVPASLSMAAAMMSVPTATANKDVALYVVAKLSAVGSQVSIL